MLGGTFHWRPRWTNWLSLALMLVAFGFWGDWQKPSKNGGAGIITFDTFEYYSYLTCAFIAKDPFLKNWQDQPHWDLAWPHETPSGNGFALKMSMGISLLHLPFFVSAHLLAEPLGFEADGFSAPYQWAIFASMLFWVGLGLRALRILLGHFFKPAIVSLTLLLIVLGTNMAWYMWVRVGVSHPFTFGLLSMYLLALWRWKENDSWQTSLLLGLLLGLMVLVRPVNLLFAFALPLLGLENLKSQARFWLARSKSLALIALSSLLTFFPQILYWKLSAGEWLHYGYGDEGFFWSNPHILAGLFGYRNGWLLYTPAMLLALTGLFFMRKHCRPWFPVIAVLLPTFIYVAMSWWCWWYIGYGHRPMIDLYALLALPLAAVLERISNWRAWSPKLALAIVLLFISHNVFQMAQARLGLIHTSAMSKEAYWSNFMRLSPGEGYPANLQRPDAKAAKQGKE